MHITAAKMAPKQVGILHFIGIGGIGMSGIAEILHNLGYQVQGSDMSENANVARLREKGITVTVGHAEENIQNAAVVVKSSAVKESNPEIVAARKKGLPIVKRAEMLAELMRLKISIAIAGTHGKTTTTSLVAAMFESANLSPTVINGGIINSHGTNAYLGSGDYLIAEADESDGTFIKVPSTIAVITNIDPEHLDYYGTFDHLRMAFKTFIEQLPFYGFALLCKDHPEVAKLAAEITDRKIITYGLQGEVDIKAVNIRKEPQGSLFDVEVSSRVTGGKRVLKNILLPVHGVHNVQNSLAPIGIALQLGFDDEIVVKGFANFKGVKRRFTKTGEVEGITVIDDYGHHPKEIVATLKTARSVLGNDGKRVIAVVQPHRFSRVHDLWEDFATCFADADIVIVADIYAAGEDPIAGITQTALVEAIKIKGKHPSVYLLKDQAALAPLVVEQAAKGDMVVCLGAGNITSWAYALPKEIESLKSKIAAKETA